MAGADSLGGLSPPSVPLSRIRWLRTSRLIPSRYPTVGPFDRVASIADLDALFELEGWTNDRLNHELGVLSVIPKHEWVTGPMASVVMAAFCHPYIGGARFSGSTRGAWYAGRTFATALAESIHRRTQEMLEVGAVDMRVEMRLYHIDFRATFHDVRGRTSVFEALHDPVNYEASQRFGQQLFEAGSNGVLYRSVRHEGGECLACMRPKLIQQLRVAGHYESRWEGSRVPHVRRIA
jgi:hypothetical protein